MQRHDAVALPRRDTFLAILGPLRLRDILDSKVRPGDSLRV